MPLPRAPLALALLALPAVLASTLRAQEPPAPKAPPAARIVGDDAPPLSVGRWIKGPPVESLDRGRVYVVDFWSPRLGACDVTIPHLSALAAKYPAATFVGVAINANDPQAAAERVRALGDRANYRLAVDGPGRPDLREGNRFVGATVADWLRTGEFSFRPMPITYLVDADGTIQWIGSPMRLEGPLAEVLAGTYDRAKSRDAALAAAAAAERRDAAEAEYELAAVNVARPPRRVRRQVIEPGHAIAGADAGDLALQERIYARHPDTAGAMLWAKFRRLMQAKQYDEAYAVADERAAAADADAQALNELAWSIVDDPSVERRDLPRARRYAERAVELSDGLNGAILDTLAKAVFLQGDVAKAIELQTRALAMADETEQDQLRGTLAEYQAQLKK